MELPDWHCFESLSNTFLHLIHYNFFFTSGLYNFLISNNKTNPDFTIAPLTQVQTSLLVEINPRSLPEKIVKRSLEGGGGQSDTPPSTFDTIRPIDLKFGTYNKLHLHFQLSETTWCLIGCHGNNSQINDVIGGRLLGFSNFQILFKFSLLYLRLTAKQHLAV